ncbi:MAG: PAS domain S-box protein [bacterium]|nr:PAS domain S-box protein [bacterium]
MGTDRPGIFARLSHLIVIQVVFIFAALALILFYPNPARQFEDKTTQLLQRVAHSAQTCLHALGEDCNGDFCRNLLSESHVHLAAIVRLGEGDDFEYQCSYDGSDQKESRTNAGSLLESYLEPAMVLFVGREGSGSLVESPPGSNLSVYYNRLEVAEKTPPAVLVSVIDSGLIFSQRSELQYALLVLFLFSTLISLLTVDLVLRRFKQPLDRLIRGLEKTAAGELYYMIEADGDKELNRLAGAFNHMTQRLWDNQKQLKKYNAKLKKSNLSILESQLFLATLIDSSPLSIIVTNTNGQILIFNRAASEVFNFAAEEVLGEDIDVLFAESPTQEAAADESAKETPGLEAICRRQDGEHFPAYVVVNPVTTQQGSLNANLYVLLDISESRNFQDMMIRLDRYCTRGEMAGDIAHEINNYLAVLMGNLELMPILLRKGNTEKIDKKLDVMKTTVDRIARFANGLMDTPQDELHFEPSSLNQVVENIIAFLKPQNRFDNIRISTELSADIPVMKLDQGQIQQLIVNLVYNASDAISDLESQRCIRVETSLVEAEGGAQVKLAVRDNGPGVPEDKAEMLFSDRFTTKRKGHGIGLITCRKIVENHGGHMDYRYCDGAEFSLVVPTERRDTSKADSDRTESPITAQG